jgi:hypothetical protein
VQAAVDTQNHLIVAHELTNVGHDRSSLAAIANQAKEALQVTQLTVVADKGYYSGEQIKDCMDLGVTPIMPKCKTSSNRSHGLFDKNAFTYDPSKNEYQCPAGQALIERFRTVEHGKTLLAYWSSSCKTCTLKPQCTTGTNRRVKRWEHEEALDQMQANLDAMPDAMKIRRCTIEHTFGTLKSWMGATHFLTKTKEHVSTEMSLHILAYNLKRVMKIMGSINLMKAMAM